MDLKEEDILGNDIGRHWYYQSKAAALRRMVGPLAPKRLLDVGAGSGFFSRHLLTEGGALSALCVDVGYPESRDETVDGKPVLYRRDCSEIRPICRAGGDDDAVVAARQCGEVRCHPGCDQNFAAVGRHLPR